MQCSTQVFIVNIMTLQFLRIVVRLNKLRMRIRDNFSLIVHFEKKVLFCDIASRVERSIGL